MALGNRNFILVLMVSDVLEEAEVATEVVVIH